MSAYTGSGRGYNYSDGGAQRQYNITYGTPSIQGPAERDLLEGLLPGVLSTIAKPRIGISKIDIEDLKCIGSYNWTNESNPTIIVPGMRSIRKYRVTPVNLVYVTFKDHLQSGGTNNPLSEYNKTTKSATSTKTDIASKLVASFLFSKQSTKSQRMILTPTGTSTGPR